MFIFLGVIIMSKVVVKHGGLKRKMTYMHDIAQAISWHATSYPESFSAIQKMIDSLSVFLQDGLR